MATPTNQLHVILMCDDRSIVRVDIASGDTLQVLFHDQWDRVESLELGDAVGQALAAQTQPNESGPATNVWVLSDEVWSGNISLPKTIVDAIPPAEIEQTLAFEAEDESGIAAFESRLRSAPLSSTGVATTWWVTQADQAQLDATQAAIPRWAILAGLTALHSSDDPDQDTSVDDSSRFDDSFALQWLADQLSDAISIPVIADPNQADNEWAQKRFRLFVSVAVLLACIGLNAWGSLYTSHRIDQLAQLASQEMELRKLVKRADGEVKRVSQAQQLAESNLRSFTQQRLQSDHQQRLHADQRQRPTQVLRALLATADPKHWIQSVQLTPQQVIVTGLAVDSAAVTRLSQAIEAELGRVRWNVEPAEMNAASKYLIGFQLKLVPIESSMGQFAMLLKGGGDVK